METEADKIRNEIKELAMRFRERGKRCQDLKNPERASAFEDAAEELDALRRRGRKAEATPSCSKMISLARDALVLLYDHPGTERYERTVLVGLDLTLAGMLHVRGAGE